MAPPAIFHNSYNTWNKKLRGHDFDKRTTITMWPIKIILRSCEWLVMVWSNFEKQKKTNC